MQGIGAIVWNMYTCTCSLLLFLLMGYHIFHVMMFRFQDDSTAKDMLTINVSLDSSALDWLGWHDQSVWFIRSGLP